MIKTIVEPLVNDLNKIDMHRFHSASGRDQSWQIANETYSTSQESKII